jgi:hypothetical protein
MTNLFDRLNLRPAERRLVVVVGILLFITLQALFVWPYFGAVDQMSRRRTKALDTLKTYQDEFAQTNKLAGELAKLEGEGLFVPPEDQAVELLRTIQGQAAQSGVSITANSKPTTRTNQFFLEQGVQITTVSTQDGLVNFLYNLGTGNSLVRVRDLTLRPDQSRMKLTATIKLVASYQKKPAVRPSTATGATSKPPAKLENRPVAPQSPPPGRPTPPRK